MAAVVCAALSSAGCGDEPAGPGATDGLPPRCGDAIATAVAGTGYSQRRPVGAPAGDYTAHAPIRIDGVHATADQPFVVAGFDIRSDTVDCITVTNSEHVIVRGNRLHDCTWSANPAEPYGQDEGFALRVGASRNVTVEDNVLESNKMGIGIHSSQDIVVRGNTIESTLVRNSLRLERVLGGEVAGNYLADNGSPEGFWVPGHRDIGIYLVRSDDIDVHDNVVLRSSSDGISVGGQIDGGGLSTAASDWTGTANRIRIHNNLILDNMELGVWLVRARQVTVDHNTIRTGCFTHGSGIGLDFDVDDSEVYNNQIVTCLNPGYVGLAMSHDDHIHDNVHFSLEMETHAVHADDDPTNDGIKAGWSGIPYVPSAGNRVEGETHLVLGGDLRIELEAKRDLADAEQTWRERGWFACEGDEGVVDPDCAEQQIASGPQGVPASYLLYEPLMADPVPYAVDPDCP